MVSLCASLLILPYLFGADAHPSALWQVFYKIACGRSKPAVCNLLSQPEILALSEIALSLLRMFSMLRLNVMIRKQLIALSL